MSIHINLLPRKTIRERVWKTLSVIVGVSTILNVSLVGALLSPQRASAQEVPASNAAPTSVSPDSVTTGAVCPAGNVKVNDGTGVEYTDGTATATIVPGSPKNTATWSASPGNVITDVCIKIGGSGGGSLQYPDPLAGSAGPYSYDISHIVITTRPLVSNPPLGQSCGLDIGLVVDRSGSVSSSEMSDMKTALTNFANAFDGTPTVFSLTSFATNSTLNRAFSRTPTQMAGDISTDIPASGDGNTNWDSGLARSYGSFDPRPAKADLMVIATDGSPNRWGYPVTDPTFDWDLGLANAIGRANTIKTAGTRIVVVGIGEDTFDPATPAEKLEKMKDISGPNVAYTPGAITTSTDVIKVTDFTGIGAALASYASELCGGKILVQKQFDTNGDGTPDIDGSTPNALLAGYTFDVNGSPSNPLPQITTNTGALEFNVDAGTYSVVEQTPLPANTKLVSATCNQPDQNVNLETRTVSNLSMPEESTISCTFVNGYDTAAISGQKFNDLNGDGTKDAGEPGLLDWTMQLQASPAWNVVDSTSTDGDGNFSFTATPGTYRVREVQQVGWMQTTADPTSFDLVGGQPVDGQNFGNFHKISISGQKYNDLNGNGSKNAGEPGLSGWTIELDKSPFRSVDATTVTNGSGNYSFTNLGPGTYRLREVGQTGWTQTSTNPADITVSSGTNVSNIDFANTRDTGFLTVNKMVDPENDGSFIGVGGSATPFRWGVDALDGATTPRYMGATATGIPTVTPFNVNENLSDVPDYHFVGWFYTNGAAQLDNNLTYNCTNPQFTSMPTGLTVAKNGTTQITLCNARDTGDLTIYKYDDNQNPLSGVTFTAGSYTGQTDQTGTLVFSDIPTGPYVVTETKPDNYHFSSVSGDCSPNANPTNVTVTTAGEQCTFTNARDMGGLRIIKQVNNDFGGAKGSGDFMINVKQSGVDIPGSPFVGVGDPGQLFPLPTGEYTISEDTVPGGYALQSIDCEVGDPSSPNRAFSIGEPPTSETVEIGEDEEITCTVINRDIQPKLTVTKIVINNNGGTKVVSDFPLFVNATPVTNNVQNGFNAGAYVVSETSDPGYVATISGNCDSQGNITLGVGDVKSCTITNDDRQATLTVIKHVSNNNGGTATAGNFTMNVTGSAATASFPGAETPGTTINVNPGSYYVDESGPSGYTASFGDDCDDSIALGEHKTCTITNDDIAPTITLTKVVNNNHGGTAGPNDFGLTVGGTAVISGQILPVMANTPIALNEAGKAGYSFVSMTGGEEPLCPSALGGTVTLALGQNISCTITNQDIASHLTVIKHVINDNGGVKTAGDFAMTIGGVTVVGGATFAGAASPGVTREVVPGVYNITETQLAGYAASFSADCAGSIALGENKTCTITNNDIISTIGLIKTATPTVVAAGGNITYTLAWSVTGSNPVTNAVITDPIPANTSFVSAANGGTFSAGTVTWNLGTLAGGSSGTVSFIVKAASPIANGTVIVNTGTFDTTETSPVTSTANTPVTSAPSLTITKTNDVVGFTNPGKSVTYTVTVTNAISATDTANAVVLTDVLPAGFTYTGIGGSTRTFNLGNITPGSSVVTTYTADISASQAAGVYTNTASAQGSNTTKVSATSPVDVRVPSVLGVTAAPDVVITKTVNPSVVNPGNLVTYTVTLSNPGDADLTNVSLTDVLPAGFTFLDTGLRERTWTIGTLKAHHQRVVDYVVKVDSSVKAGKYDNLATVLSNELDPSTAKVTVEVKVPKVLGLATTGASARDFMIFAFGLGLVGFGLYWAGRQRRSKHEPAA